MMGNWDRCVGKGTSVELSMCLETDSMFKKGQGQVELKVGRVCEGRRKCWGGREDNCWPFSSRPSGDGPLVLGEGK